MIATGSKNPKKSTKQTPKPIEPKIEKVEKVEQRPYFMIVYRQRGEDPWHHKGLGMEFFRDKEFARSGIPAEATEAYIIEIELPL